MEKLDEELDDLVSYVKSTDDYQKCISLKQKMDENEDIKKLVNEIKKIQKKYIKSNYDEKIKAELDQKNEELSSIPIYVIYNQSLEKVNEMIDYIKDSFNDYFYDLLNKKNKSDD